jgi:hypothetical protein
VDEIATLAALDDGERKQQTADAAKEGWDTLLAQVGLDEDGGADVSDQLVAALAPSVEALSDQIHPAGATAPPGDAGTTAPDGPSKLAMGGRLAIRGDGDPPVSSYGAVFFGLMELGLMGKAAVRASNDGKPLDGGLDHPTPENDVTVKADRERATMTAKHDKTIDGTRLKMENKTDVQACPDAKGAFTAEAHLDAHISKGKKSGLAQIDVTVHGELNDDAQLAASDFDYRIQMADSGDDGHSFLDVSEGVRQTGIETGDSQWAAGREYTVNRAAGTLTNDQVTGYVKMGRLLAITVGIELRNAAAEGWESGRCVELKVTTDPAERTGLKPGTDVAIDAAPRSQLDGSPTGGTVLAKLSGAARVEPMNTKVDADASFTYTAPDESGKGGTVALEARSRRGVGKASVEFNTNAKRYQASGGGGGLTVDGVVDDLGAPFVLHGAFPGATVDFHYTPSSDRAGSLTYDGGGGGVTVKGSGSYTIAGDDPDGVLTMTTNENGCATPGACRATSDVITLTPIT